MYCKQCGKELQDEAKFCKYCGEKTPVVKPVGLSNMALINNVNVASQVPPVGNVQTAEHVTPQANIASTTHNSVGKEPLNREDQGSTSTTQPKYVIPPSAYQVPKKNSSGIIIAIVVSFFVLLVLVGGGLYLVNKADDSSSSMFKIFHKEDTNKAHLKHIEEQPTRSKAIDKVRGDDEVNSVMSNEPIQDPVDMAAKEATKTFIDIHKNITKKDYEAAYSKYSNKMKNQVGDLNGWAQGYRTTIVSKVVQVHVESKTPTQVVLKYKLKAVDKSGQGTVTRFFVGTAVLIKEQGNWCLDEMSASEA